MNTQVKFVSTFIAAFCLALAIGVAGMTGTAGVAFAEEPALATGEIAVEHADGWQQDETGWHFWRSNVMVKGEWVTTAAGPNINKVTVNSHNYWLSQDGTLAVGRLVDPTSANDAGAGFYAYAGADGYAVTGKKVVGDLVYLAKSTGELESGNSSGILVTSNYDSKKRRYYIDPDLHAAVTGKAVKAGNYGWVYAYPKKGYLLTGVKKVDSKHVVLADSNGKIYNKAGWVSTKKYTGKTKQRYYLERSKVSDTLYGARIGSFKVKGKRYYGQSKGYVFTKGYKLIGKKYYRADKKGVLKYNKVITKMYKKAQGYSSPSKYLIMVDVNDTKFMVFTGKKGKWKTKYIWDCSTGHPSTPTPIGVWHVGIKGPSFGHGYTCYYYTQFNGDYLIHTRIYREGTHILQDAAMNTQVSQGCVRLYDKNAYWVYKNIPGGTTVVTIP